MTSREYRVLKLYATRHDMTMGEVLREFARAGVHRHTKVCHTVEQILKSESVPLDRRIEKDCWSELCTCCKHRVDCADQNYCGLFEFNSERFGKWEDVGKGDLPTFEK